MASAQDVEVVYHMTFKSNGYLENLLDGNVPPSVADKMLDDFKNTKEEFSLKISEGRSSFTFTKFLKEDSDKVGSFHQTIRNDIYKDHSARIFSFLDTECGIGKETVLDDWESTGPWTFEDQDTTIAGFLSNKATNSQGDIIWYTPDIPIPDGPFHFAGFPGLVIGAEFKNKVIIMEQFNNVESVSQIVITTPKAKPISLADYRGLNDNCFSSSVKY